jgi:predicted DNA-binding protein (MmcQ/YjbR family)
MTVDDVVAHCMAKPGAQESYPRGDEELVCKVGGKAYAFIGLSGGTVGVKCGADAEAAGEWRERYPEDIKISSYIGRYGWNTVSIAGAVHEDDLRELLDSSYEAVVAKLPKSKRPVSPPAARSASS